MANASFLSLEEIALHCSRINAMENCCGTKH